MDTFKIQRANKLYSKIQGAMWARDKNVEYKHYDLAKNCDKVIDDCYDEINGLSLSKEERNETGFDHYDYDLAMNYFYSLR